MRKSIRGRVVPIFALALAPALIASGLTSSANGAGEVPLSGIVIAGATGALDDDLSLDTNWLCPADDTVVGVQLSGAGLTTTKDLLAPVAINDTNAPSNDIGGFHLEVPTTLAQLFAANGVGSETGDYVLTVNCGIEADPVRLWVGKRLRFTSTESGTTYEQIEPVSPKVTLNPNFESPVVYDPAHALHFTMGLDPDEAEGVIRPVIDGAHGPSAITPAPVLESWLALTPGTHSVTASFTPAHWYAYRPAVSQTMTVVVVGPTTIYGTARFGNAVTCTGVSGATRSYSWILDGTKTSSLTSSKVKVPLSWIGHSLGCKIKTADADSSVTVASAPQVVLYAHAPINYTSPSVRGVARRGEVLTCSAGVWDPRPASFTYRWLRNGKPLYGADGSHRTVTSGDRGQLLSCVVHTHLAGHLQARAQAPARRVSSRW